MDINISVGDIRQDVFLHTSRRARIFSLDKGVPNIQEEFTLAEPEKDILIVESEHIRKISDDVYCIVISKKDVTTAVQDATKALAKTAGDIKLDISSAVQARETEIEVPLTDLFEQCKRVTASRASVILKQNSYSSLSFNEIHMENSDRPLFEIFYNEATSFISDILSKYVVSFSGGTYVLRLNAVPSGENDIANAVSSYVLDYILYKYYMHVMLPDVAQAYKQAVTDFLAKINAIIADQTGSGGLLDTLVTEGARLLHSLLFPLQRELETESFTTDGDDMMFAVLAKELRIPSSSLEVVREQGETLIVNHALGRWLAICGRSTSDPDAVCETASDNIKFYVERRLKKNDLFTSYLRTACENIYAMIEAYRCHDYRLTDEEISFSLPFLYVGATETVRQLIVQTILSLWYASISDREACETAEAERVKLEKRLSNIIGRHRKTRRVSWP